ncbi:MAG: hypothetical protein IKS54_11785 [Erysipelotrichaceae bacterium]|nr:hypothetical protein [Erysipelotrichaceae bacterium]
MFRLDRNKDTKNKRIIKAFSAFFICLFLVSCGGSSKSGNNEITETLPPELEGNSNIKGHEYEGLYYRLSVPENYWVEKYPYEDKTKAMARIYTVNEELREIAKSVDMEFTPSYYNVFLLEESYEEDGKSALDIYEEWEAYGGSEEVLYILNPQGLDVPVYVIAHVMKDFKTLFAYFDNPDGKLSYISAGLWNEEMEDVLTEMINGLEYVR